MFYAGSLIMSGINFQSHTRLAFKVKETMHLIIGHTIEFEILEKVKTSAQGDIIVYLKVVLETVSPILNMFFARQ